MSMQILVLEGDGIGPEITAATRQVLEAIDGRFGLNLEFQTADMGFAALEKYGTTFPDTVSEQALAAAGTIMGPISHNDYPPAAEGGQNPSAEMRKRLNLWANIRPAHTIPGFTPPCGHPLDLVIVRENTEGFYADRSMYLGLGEFMPTPDIALSVRKITRQACLNIAERAFIMAGERRRKVTAVHKANVLRVTDGLFLECTREVAARYPAIHYEEKIIDAMAALLVRQPSVFDIIVTTNMFGDILSDLAAELAGSLGLAASINASETHCVAQAQHGSAPDIAGQNIANPSSLIGSAAMLLQWLGNHHQLPNFTQAAEAIHNALTQTLSNPQTRTADLGGSLTTTAFTAALIETLNHLNQ